MTVDLTEREALRLLNIVREQQDITQGHRMCTPRQHIGFHYMLDDTSVDLASIAGKLDTKGAK